MLYLRVCARGDIGLFSPEIPPHMSAKCAPWRAVTAPFLQLCTLFCVMFVNLLWGHFQCDVIDLECHQDGFKVAHKVNVRFSAATEQHNRKWNLAAGYNKVKLY